MRNLKNICEKIIQVHKNQKFPYIYDIELSLANKDQLKRCQQLECHIVLYPYSRIITSSEFEFTPFEEYISDILSRQKSAYIQIKNSFAKIFGIFLGALITGIFLWLKPADLLSVESIISVFGAYFVGKELWDDIEDFFISLSKNLRLRYQEKYYYYKLEKATTLSLYSYYAKKRRYGTASVLPDRMDFIQKRNSQTIRMLFNMKDFISVDDPTAHILSIRINPQLVDTFEKEGYMLGLKLSFNRRFMGFTRYREVFQSMESDTLGCLDHKGQWYPDAVFYRNTFSVGQLKYFMNKGILNNKSIIQYHH